MRTVSPQTNVPSYQEVPELPRRKSSSIREGIRKFSTMQALMLPSGVSMAEPTNPPCLGSDYRDNMDTYSKYTGEARLSAGLASIDGKWRPRVACSTMYKYYTYNLIHNITNIH